MNPYKILAPVDFSDASLEALGRALFLAGKLQGEVWLLNVIPGPEGPKTDGPTDEEIVRDNLSGAFHERLTALEDPDPRLRAEGPKILIHRGKAADWILATAANEGVDLIVLGTHGRRGVARALLGSVAERVIREAQCPVLTCRASVREPART